MSASPVMRPSRVLARMRAGEVASCFKMNLADPRAFEIAAMSGFDCLWTDMEHVPNGWHTIENQVLAAKAYDVDLLVRVSRGGYSDTIRPLEMDAAGIMVPHIMGVEDAKKVVYYSKFHPVGRRPLDGGNADGAYCAISLEDYMRDANRERFVIVQIEDPEPLEEMDEIAALPGIDMLFFGPGDFSQGIGAPGVWDDPRLLDARRRVAAVATAHGKFAGTVGGPGNFRELVDMGYRFISMGADVVGLSNYCREMASAFGSRPWKKNSDGVYDAK